MDAFFAVFGSALDAVTAAAQGVDHEQHLAMETASLPVRVRTTTVVHAMAYAYSPLLGRKATKAQREYESPGCARANGETDPILMAPRAHGGSGPRSVTS